MVRKEEKKIRGDNKTLEEKDKKERSSVKQERDRN
jgi:hypothetical protein